MRHPLGWRADRLELGRQLAGVSREVVAPFFVSDLPTERFYGASCGNEASGVHAGVDGGSGAWGDGAVGVAEGAGGGDEAVKERT